MILIFVIQAIYFGVIRKIIVAENTNFPSIFVISTVHLLFYGVFFLSLEFIYQLFLKKRVIYRMVNFQNYAKVSEHEDAKRRFEHYYYFSLELIGPLFFLIIENVNGTTCYAQDCLLEFENYVISRYLLDILLNLFKNIIKFGKIAKHRSSKAEYEKTLDIKD